MQIEKQGYLPIVVIGAGGIVQDSHLPAYQKAGFSVKGIFDLDFQKATKVAEKFAIGEVYKTLDEALVNNGKEVVYDLAVPGNAHAGILAQLPETAAVLLQKPMGDDLQQAEKILSICRSKQLKAAVNFQLRYAPSLLAAKKLISDGLIGDLLDMEVNVNVYTPWKLWPFLFGAPRMEILYHSIHYLDLARHLMGEPDNMVASSIQHPEMLELSSVKSTLLMQFGACKRALIHTNHCHYFGRQHQHSFIKLEGTKGVIRIGMGVLMDYPKGEPDTLEYITLIGEQEHAGWQTLELNGNWFPDAFVGSMEEVLQVASGRKAAANNSVEDAIKTMQWVERCYTDLNLKNIQ